ncbi:MAG: hypothetical protein J5527_10105 [Treponema sp.]|nr:hypothetical protein [Treponema sp.]
MMDRFLSEMYEIPPKKIPEYFYKGIELVGKTITNEIKNNHIDDFSWINTIPLYPSFHHLSFRFKQSVFSILLDFGKNEVNSMWQTKFFSKLKDDLINRQINECERYNLIPCKFCIDLNTFTSVNPNMNLINSITNQICNPLEIASTEDTIMSSWEINNFAIQIVLDDLRKKGFKICSYCDLPGIEPQIWFEDETGRNCWILVKYLKDDTEDDYHKWQGLQNTNDVLKEHDGYFAGVQFFQGESQQLIRGRATFVKYKGLQRNWVY